MKRAVKAAEKIPGWMSREELEWLAVKASERETIVEIGSYMGRSTKCLALSTPGVVYSVDNLHGEDVTTESHKHPGSSKQSLDKAFRENCAAEIASGKIRIIRRPSLSAAREFKGKADMIFIDADHDRNRVIREVTEWRKRLAPGGLLCGHDSTDPRVEMALEHLGIEGRGPDRIWLCE